MTKKLFGLMLVVVVLATLTGGTALASANGGAAEASDLPGQDYFTLVGTILAFSPDGEVITVETIEVLLHNGNRFVKPVDVGDIQTVYTSENTEYNTIGLVRGETVSIHGTVDEAGDFMAERVTVGVPCPACPELP